MHLPDIHPIILAGGLGTRLRRVLPETPKPLAPVAGRPFIEWVVRFLAKQGFRAATISTGYRAEEFERHFGGTPIDGVSVRCVAEPRPLGTGGGFLFAARASQMAPLAWLILNGDSLTFPDMAAFASLLDSSGVDAAMIAHEAMDASRYGTLVVDADGRLRRFDEKVAGRGLVNAGIYLIRAALAAAVTGDGAPADAAMGVSMERELLPGWLGAGRCIMVHRVEAPFLDIGTEESLVRAERFILDNQEQFA